MTYHLNCGIARCHHSVINPSPSERPTLKHIMGHMWLMQREESLLNPLIGTVPKHPDPTILASMSNLDYNPCEVHECLLNRIFKEEINSHISHAKTANMPGDYLQGPHYVVVGPVPKV
jgi:hypothetical protein